MDTSGKRESGHFDRAEMPFVAPCRNIGYDAPLRWIRQGWSDIRRAPRQSLLYGMALMLLSYLVAGLAWKLGSFIIMVALMSGFMFIGPVLAIGLYSISCQLQLGKKPVLGYCLREGRRHLGNVVMFAVILLVVFLLWARAASTVHIFFPPEAHPDWRDMALFLGIGSAIGALFSAIIFCAGAFSLPMLMDRQVDVITAMLTSIHAVLRNKGPMLVWAAIIVLFSAIGFLTATLFVLLPLIGHATWHAYQETIDASAWPQHGEPARQVQEKH